MKRIIVGGGASGLVCAIESAKKGYSVLVIDANERMGKKLSQTGNGRCNLLNEELREGFFGGDLPLVRLLLEKFPLEKVKSVLLSYGIYTFADEHKRVYPITENANSVVDCLLFQCKKHKVSLVNSALVEDISVLSKGGYLLNTSVGDFTADSVVLATGSAASAQQRKPLVEEKWLTALSPSLVPVKTKNVDKSLNGQRRKCTATLLKNGERVASEQGEVLFRDYGLSGMCIFNLSAHIARDTVKNESEQYSISLDLLPEFSKEELQRILIERSASNYGKNLLLGLLPNKIAESVLKNGRTAEEIAYYAKHFSFEVEKLLDLSMAQVVSGGVAKEFFDDKLRLPNGVSVCGELLNVDGLCGGYNLWFAFASGLFVAEN